MNFFTIGVYNSTEEEFFRKLADQRIEVFCDIRQRRGVRGSEYAFANSNRLQARLAKMKIRYEHVAALSTPDELRKIQLQADAKEGVGQRSRHHLTDQFISRYKKDVLDAFDLSTWIKELKGSGAKRIVLFCVEENPSACHRSLVAEKIGAQYKFPVKHL